MGFDLFNAFRVEVGMHVPATTLDPFREGSVEGQAASAATLDWPHAVGSFLREVDVSFASQVTPYQISRSVTDSTPITQGLLTVHWELDDDSYANGGWLLPLWFVSMQYRETRRPGQQIVGIEFDPLGKLTEYRTTPLGLVYRKPPEITWERLDRIVETGTDET